MRRWAVTCGRVWRWRWSAISTAKPVKRPSPRSCCRSWRRRPAQGSNGWWCWTRLYCNLSFPQQVLKAGGHFLIRYCTNTTFVPDPARPARESRDAKGHRIVQEWGWLGKVEKAGRVRVPVSRITKHLRDGKEIGVVTDLLDEVKYPAEAMLTTYQSRLRGIETVFHQITDVFSLRHLIGTMPKANTVSDVVLPADVQRAASRLYHHLGVVPGM